MNGEPVDPATDIPRGLSETQNAGTQGGSVRTVVEEA
jgi:hypothetical protein